MTRGRKSVFVPLRQELDDASEHRCGECGSFAEVPDTLGLCEHCYHCLHCDWCNGGPGGPPWWGDYVEGRLVA